MARPRRYEPLARRPRRRYSRICDSQWLSRARSTPAIRPRREPARRAGSDSAGGRAISIGIARRCCRGSASAMAPAGAAGFGRLGSRTSAGGGQLPPPWPPWPPRLPKRPKPRQPARSELRPPARSMAHRPGAVSAIKTGFAMITRARPRRGQPTPCRAEDGPSPSPARAWPVTGGPRRAARRRTPRRRPTPDSTLAERDQNGGRLSRRRQYLLSGAPTSTMTGAKAITASVTAQDSNTRATTTRPRLIRSRLTVPLCAPPSLPGPPRGHAVSEPCTIAQPPRIPPPPRPS